MPDMLSVMNYVFPKTWDTHALGVVVVVTVTAGTARKELQYGTASDGDAWKHLSKLFRFLHTGFCDPGTMIAPPSTGERTVPNTVTKVMRFMVIVRCSDCPMCSDDPQGEKKDGGEECKHLGVQYLPLYNTK